MLSKRLPSILPDMTRQEQLEVTQIYSVLGLLPAEHPLIESRPFRAPHHTVSAGCARRRRRDNVRPGEISLAHKGVLFLDELPEFRRDALRPCASRWRTERSPSPGSGAVTIPGGIYAGVRHESLQMRLVRRPLRALPLLPAGRCGKLSKPHFRAASGQN